MGRVRVITGLKMTSSQTTDEFSTIVRDTYCQFYAEPKGICPPNISRHLFAWEQLWVGSSERELGTDIQLGFFKEDSPPPFAVAKARTIKYAKNLGNTHAAHIPDASFTSSAVANMCCKYVASDE